MLIYLSVICTLVLIGIIFVALILCVVVGNLLKVRGDIEYITDILSKDYAKKVADLMIEKGFVAKKITITEEEARKLAKEFYSKEKENGN